MLFPIFAFAEKLSDIPSVRFEVTQKRISLILLSRIKANEIVADGDSALINSGRRIWQIKAGNGKMEEKLVDVFPGRAVWYGPACAMKSGFVVAVQEYPEEQKNAEDNSPRGSFRAGPKPEGFFILRPFSPARHLETLDITSRPPPGPGAEYISDKRFYGHVQSCAWDGRAMVVGSYGSLGRADFDSGTIELIDEDRELEFNRSLLMVEPKTIWVGVDEGGMGGATLERRSASGKPNGFSIEADEDIVSYNALARHRGRLFVGTSHGLFSLDEPSGRFHRIDFGKWLFDAPVYELVSRENSLWVFIGGAWLRVDARNRRAVRYVDSDSTTLITGIPFDGGWLLSGPGGVWKYQASFRKTFPPTVRALMDKAARYLKQ